MCSMKCLKQSSCKYTFIWCFSCSQWVKTRVYFIHIAFDFSAEYAIRNNQEIQEGLKLNSLYHILVYANGVKLGQKYYKE